MLIEADRSVAALRRAPCWSLAISFGRFQIPGRNRRELWRPTSHPFCALDEYGNAVYLGRVQLH